MIDGKSGQRKIKTLIKSVDEASHQSTSLITIPSSGLSSGTMILASVVTLKDANDVTAALIGVSVDRGTSTRPCGPTRGRRWRGQITGTSELQLMQSRP